jgi:hypothetical protein
MGMFNHVRCTYPLPDPEAQDFDFQTKSLPEQMLDYYEITADGRLMHEAYQVRWEENPTAPLGFYIHRENCRWEPDDFTGEMEIHQSYFRPDGSGVWYSYLFEFEKGQVVGMQHGHDHGMPLPSQPRPRPVAPG